MQPDLTRRRFLRNAALASGSVAAAAEAQSRSAAIPAARRPNILMICADQFRADFIAANGANPSTRTPHLDALAARGANFRNAITNQPLCSPSRASFLTGMYANRTGVWKLGIELDHTLPTIATELGKNGYKTAFMGKWHVSANEDAQGKPQRGWIPPGPSRGGFDLWEGANILETVSHPYEGSYWDNSGADIGFKDVYRVDFITGRAVSFLEAQASSPQPWLLFVSQLEPHQQNDTDDFPPPKRYEKSFNNAFVPHDLRNLPGNWQTRLPGYYGCVQAIDDCVGALVQTLEKTGQLDNTVIVFFSDHGCTFRTRLGEYKRSPHDSSLRVPFLVAGPGFDRSVVVRQIVSLIDLTPTLLDAAGVPPPRTMQGKPLKPLANDTSARAAWDNTAYVQISESIVGRAIRTPDWVYCAYDPTIPKGEAEHSLNYQDFALYSIAGDPHQQVNLVGRPEYKAICTTLRDELKKRIVANGEPEPTIEAVQFYA